MTKGIIFQLPFVPDNVQGIVESEKKLKTLVEVARLEEQPELIKTEWKGKDVSGRHFKGESGDYIFVNDIDLAVAISADLVEIAVNEIRKRQAN